MPELPEVETLRRGLAPALEGKRIERVVLNRQDLRKGNRFPSDFSHRLEGATIGPLGRRAKYLLLPLDTGETLVIHLGMSGRLIPHQDGRALLAPDAYYQKLLHNPVHNHVVLCFGSSFEQGESLVFNDPRRFGSMTIEPTETALAHHRLGPEPLGNDFHADALMKAVAQRASPLKSLLLDPKVVAGLGNIYVCEALNRAHISPFRAGKTLTRTEAEQLVIAIRAVLERAIQLGGSTISDHRQADGSAGGFQDEFVAYDRAGQACRNLHCTGHIARQVQAGRSTFFCAQCQVGD